MWVEVMAKCMIMSTVSKNSLIAWKVDFFFSCAAHWPNGKMTNVNEKKMSKLINSELLST